MANGRLVPNNDGYSNPTYREGGFRNTGYREGYRQQQQQPWQLYQVGPLRMGQPAMGPVFMNRGPPPGPRPAPQPGQRMPHPHT